MSDESDARSGVTATTGTKSAYTKSGYTDASPESRTGTQTGEPSRTAISGKSSSKRLGTRSVDIGRIEDVQGMSQTQSKYDQSRREISESAKQTKRNRVIVVSVLFVFLFIAVMGLYLVVYLTRVVTDEEYKTMKDYIDSIKTLKASDSCPGKGDGFAKRVVVYLSPYSTNVLCDTVSDSGKWIIFQRRIADDESFDRVYNAYAQGFGKVSTTSSFWLGLDMLSYLCEKNKCEMRVDMAYKQSAKNKRGRYHAKYSSFKVDSRSNNYTISLSEYSGTAGDALGKQNGATFSAKGSDSKSCAAQHNGFWHKAQDDCTDGNPNGNWGSTDQNRGIFWDGVTSRTASLRFVEMKVRMV